MTKNILFTPGGFTPNPQSISPDSAAERSVARSTQQIATCALALFARLIQNIEHITLPDFQRASTRKRVLPVV